MMKILHVFRTPVGGLFRHVCDLAAQQAARGHEVGAIFDSSTGDALSLERLEMLAGSCALGIHPIPMSRTVSHRDIGGLLATRRLAQTLNIDVLHGHGAKGGAFARMASRMTMRPTRRPKALYTPHGGSLHYDPRSAEGRVFLGLERLLERWSDGLIFESAYSAKIYADKVGPTQAPAKVVPNGLLAREFAGVAPASTAADFLYIGELRTLKGVDVLLKALAIVQTERPVSAVIVGAGPDAAAFQALAGDLGLSRCVRFTGAMPARAAFALGLTLVVPSRAESFPYIVLEAAAAGLPLIATSVGGIPEILTGNDAGMVAPNDIEALAGAMRHALRDPGAMHARAEALQASVAARFTVGRMTDAVLDFYGEARPERSAFRASRSGAH